MRIAIVFVLLLACAAWAADPDRDGDGLSDFQERHKYFTDPDKADSDGDGIPDGDADERREYTYTVRTVVQVMRPVDDPPAADLQRGTLDARLIPGLKIQNVHLIPTTFGPPRIHPCEHLRPILGFQATRTRMDGEKGTSVVVRPLEHRSDLQGFRPSTEIVDLREPFRLQLRVFVRLKELAQLRQLGGFSVQLRPGSDPSLQPIGFVDDLASSLLIIPEARTRHRLVELGEASLLCRDVKDTPEDRRCARRVPSIAVARLCS